jgi:Tfp pilus assembly protein PilF
LARLTRSMPDITENLEAMLARGNDNALLRLTLAARYFERGVLDRALEHAEVAVNLDADYSAAWRLLGRIQAATGLGAQAAQTYRHGIAVAERRGDQQAAKEMRVFLRRLEAASKE